MSFRRTKLCKKDKTATGVNGSDLGWPNKGEVIHDVQACPQDIVYPTNIGRLDKS